MKGRAEAEAGQSPEDKKGGVRASATPSRSRKKKGTQHTVASITLYRTATGIQGTHISRFIEVLNEYREDIHIKNFEHTQRDKAHSGCPERTI
jgi:GTP cyclohydrolase FolE2